MIWFHRPITTNTPRRIVDRLALLPENDNFVFDFNQAQQNPGQGGEIVSANRKNFPALVGTGAGMAVGRIGRKHLHTHASILPPVRDPC